MFKWVDTDPEATLDNGVEFKPIATLADEHGGRCQIFIDDGCYVIALKQESGKYRLTKHIFPEVFQVLRHLPCLSER